MRNRRAIFIKNEQVMFSVTSLVALLVMIRPLGHFSKSGNYQFRGKMIRVGERVIGTQD